ncbi:DeoR/GlpR family DNA-binding transcription regulator (plasmid) [Entomospira entomophila]|uniref:DeoR/GlpR transcriptional regulator n=1 Tax=Entomospira entomophila TaxID=2719988 RepID=A0A968GE00_9SPIO|nr:DeoR/GlpR family DNA-binding transcription regulator [Entomospira entomophilus]NIZ41289.1 DeoR/GlpR transcriptional regulator [Entomospira entomophilus]WDI36185.1 DeoR/GlpR family DNA-binding transcription regulator [Entomospira entomophilus]
MGKEQRQRELLSLLKEKPLIKIHQIAAIFHVTTMTIQRDINDLHKKNLVIKTHGGAFVPGDMLTELSHQQKEQIHTPAKDQIAQIASSYIQDGDVVYLGAGTTCMSLLDQIRSMNLQIVTNSLSIFNEAIQYPNLEVILSGGQLRTHTQMFVGKFTKNFFGSMTLAKTFMSSNGVNLDSFSVANEQEAEVNQLILSQSKERYLLVDHSKFDVQYFYPFWEINQVDQIITNDKQLIDPAYGLYPQIIDRVKKDR